MARAARRTVDQVGTNVPPVVATALAATSWAGALGLPPFTFAAEAPLSASFVGGVLALAVVMVIWLLDDSTARTCLALVAIAWFGTSLQGLVGMPPLLVQLTAATGPLALVGLASWVPPGPRRWVAALCGLAMVAHVLGYQPLLDPACLSPCPEVAAPVADRLGGRAGLLTALLPELTGYVVLVVGALRSALPVLERTVVTTVGGCFLAADWIPWIRWGALEASQIPDLLRTLGTALATGAAAFAVLRVRRARSHLQALVHKLGDDRGTTIEGVQSLLFAVPASSRWIDVGGRERPPGPGRTLPGPDGNPSVLLVTARAQGLVEGITPVTLLTLDNKRLAAVATWRLAQLRDSQARIVAASDRERHRIDRDLHDGAQQQLVGAAMHLAAARDRLDAPTAATLDGVGALIHEALGGLRTITHRSLLTVLTTEGLTAAVEDLADSSGGTVDVSVGELPELPASVERATYDIVAFGLGTRRAQSARVGCDHGMLRVEVVVAGTLNDLARVADRVGATGGELTVVRVPGDRPLTRLSGSWPCAW